MFKIHIQSQLLSKDTQYCQHCNNVKLHAVQCTSTRFLTNAHFNNKGYTSIHKSLQKLEFLKIFALKHAIIYFFWLFAYNNYVIGQAPYVIGQAIIFLPCSFFYLLSLFYSSPNLSRRRLDDYHTSTHGVALVRI